MNRLYRVFTRGEPIVGLWQFLGLRLCFGRMRIKFEDIFQFVRETFLRR